MFLAFLLALILGVVSGLVPGLHSNTVIAMLSAFGFPDSDFAVMIVVLLGVHTLVAFVPSIFFGVPEQRSVVSALAGQQLVMDGKGLTALKTVLASAAFAALLSTALFYVSLDWFPALYALIQPYIRYILLVLSAVLVIRSKNPLLSLVLFLLAGMLGIYTLHTKMLDPFLPLFSGLFAMAAMLTYQKASIPEQKEEALSPDTLKFSLAGVVGGFLADLLPGISSASQVAVVLAVFMPMNSLAYLSAVASITVSEAIFSFATAASIDKSRMGATVWLDKTIPIESNLLLILVLFLLAIALAAGLLYFARKWFARLAELDFGLLHRLLALYLVAIVFILDGGEGLLILAVASLLGYLAIKLDVERRNLMGAVILPTLMLLFRIFL